MRVFSNTAISLDGRIGTVAFDHVVLGTPLDRHYMSVLRARADAVLVGGRTFRNWPLPLVPDARAIDALRAAGFPDVEVPPLEGRRWKNVVLTRTFDLPPAPRFYGDDRVEPLVFSTQAGEIPRGEVVALPGQPDGSLDLPAVFAALAARGVQDLLVEAGGDLLFQLLAHDLLDELYVTVCPVIVGGRGAPTLADGAGFSPEALRRLELVSAHQVGAELYTRYRVRR